MQCLVNTFTCCCCIALYLYTMSRHSNFWKHLYNPYNASHFNVLPSNFAQTMLYIAQQSELPTIITCNLHQSFIVGPSLWGAQNYKRSIGEDHWCNPLWTMKFKIFGGTIENSTMNDERGPHEWSHDVFMITCIYPNAMGWPLVNVMWL